MLKPVQHDIPFFRNGRASAGSLREPQCIAAQAAHETAKPQKKSFPLIRLSKIFVVTLQNNKKTDSLCIQWTKHTTA